MRQSNSVCTNMDITTETTMAKSSYCAKKHKCNITSFKTALKRKTSLGETQNVSVKATSELAINNAENKRDSTLRSQKGGCKELQIDGLSHHAAYSDKSKINSFNLDPFDDITKEPTTPSSNQQVRISIVFLKCNLLYAE